MSAGQSSSLPSPNFDKQDIQQVYPSVDFNTSSTSYVAVTGWSLTIPSDGYFTIVAAGTALANDGSGSGAISILTLHVDGVEKVSTKTVDGFAFGTANEDHWNSFHIEDTAYFNAGQVITLMARCGSAGDALNVYSSASAYGAVMKLVKETGIVPTIPRDYIFSTTETNTGKVWIDGKPIYRKVISGTTGAGGSSTQALGVTVDSMVVLEFWIDSSSFGWECLSGSSSGSNVHMVYFTNTTQNEMTLYHGVAHLQSRPYNLILEYTK